jgi:fluoroacetyl-CoA thioesterase
MTPGLEHELRFVEPATKLVPALYPESPDFREMPPVFGRAFSSDCWNGPASRLSSRTSTGRAAERRKLVFEVEAHDGIDVISTGRHERVVIERSRLIDRAFRKTGL